MGQKDRTWAVTAAVVLGCLLMYGVESWLRPGYFTKSLIKIIVFAGLPTLALLPRGIGQLVALFQPRQKKQLLRWLPVGGLVYFGILGGYALLRPYIDLNHIAGQLGGDLGVTRDNFIYVALYISVVNSFLEEFFFRGAAFLLLKQHLPRWAAYGFGALSFGLYHVAILTGWFSPLLFGVILVGLCLTGLFFNLLDDAAQSIYPSWMVHLCANLAINTIGLHMFGIL